MQKIATHGNGISCTFARTDTKWFHEFVFERAHAVLFLAGRVKFIRSDGAQPKAGCGGGIVLAAFGYKAARRLADSSLRGAYMRLRI